MIRVRSRRVAIALRRVFAAAGLILVASVSGCIVSTFGELDPAETVQAEGPVASTGDFDRSRLIAADFVAALIDIPSLSPAHTSMVTDEPDSRFALLLLGALQDAGYELRIGGGQGSGESGDESDDGGGGGGGGGGGKATLDWRIEPDTASNRSDRWTFTVEAGGISLRRRYRVADDGVSPVTPMRVTGASEAGPLREHNPGPVPSPLIETRRTPMPRAMPTGAKRAGDDREADREAGGEEGGGVPNLFRTGVSRHAARLSGHRVMRSTVLVFPNDSLRLGRDNKRQVVDIVERFDAARDLLSVIGCSHGATALTNGNERLALGRAERVRDEIASAGIALDRVLDEGCWAGRGHATMPPRGVVITHHRRTG